MYQEKIKKIDSKATLSPIDTPFAWSYLVSPLKISQVIGVSCLILPGQILFSLGVMNVIYNSAKKFAAFCTASCFGQKVS
jgi:hypothetical protein